MRQNEPAISAQGIPHRFQANSIGCLHQIDGKSESQGITFSTMHANQLSPDSGEELAAHPNHHGIDVP
jgi:hypothetical protein